MQRKFEADRITCICDVLVKTGDNIFDLYEIKSSTHAKPEHEPDLQNASARTLFEAV